ncbi:MAG: hypothetical protein NFCOHLIN_01492 [Gammaproteobacteria bacterium]|nr:hypothetical protein [Gammaproteobacteria bacterium]
MIPDRMPSTMANNKKEDRTPAAQRTLQVCRRQLSDENWAAGWLMVLEYTLWDWVTRWRVRSEPASEFERANRADTEALSWPAAGHLKHKAKRSFMQRLER